MRRIAAAGGSTVDPYSLPSPDDVAPGVLAAVDALPPEESGSWIGIDGSLVMEQPATGYS